MVAPSTTISSSSGAPALTRQDVLRSAISRRTSPRARTPGSVSKTQRPGRWRRRVEARKAVYSTATAVLLAKPNRRSKVAVAPATKATAANASSSTTSGARRSRRTISVKRRLPLPRLWSRHRSLYLRQGRGAGGCRVQSPQIRRRLHDVGALARRLRPARAPARPCRSPCCCPGGLGPRCSSGCGHDRRLSG